MYTNTLVSWVLSINNHKNLTEYKFGTELLQNWIQVPTVQLAQWVTLVMSPFFNLPIWKMLGLDQGYSFQLWVCFIIHESCLLLHPISIVLKAHFSSFSPVRMIASFPLSNLITYFYIFVGYYVFFPSLLHMDEQHTLSSASKASTSFFIIFFHGYFLNPIS